MTSIDYSTQTHKRLHVNQKVFVNSFASGTDPTHKIEKPLMSKLSSILFARALSF